MSTDRSRWDNRGRIKRNPRKLEPRHPDFKGAATIDGVEYWLSAWVNEDPGKEASIGINFERKETQPQADAPAQDDRTESWMAPTATKGSQPAGLAAGRAPQPPNPGYGDVPGTADFDDDIPF